MAKIAIAGIGYWGKNLVRVFSEISDIVACVHNGSEENEEWLRKNYPEIDITVNYNRIVSNPEIDAVVIATPIGTHYELVKKALLQNKHVFVEKPLAESPEKAKQLSDLAKQKNRVLFVGYIFAYHPTIQPLFDKGISTPIIWGEFKWNKFGDLGEDIFLDVVSHPIAVSLALFNEAPTSTSVNYSNSITGDTDIVSLELEFQRGVFDIYINRVTPMSEKSLQVLFEDKELFYWNEQGLYEFDENKNGYLEKKEASIEPLKSECQNFISAIDRDGHVRTDGEFSYIVNDVLEQIENEI